MSATTTVSSQSSARDRSVVTAVLVRVPLVALTVAFALLGMRYLANPVRAAAETGIAFTSPGGITAARVGFAGFPLSFAGFFFVGLFSADRLLSALRAELMLLGIVMVVRVASMAAMHSSETAKLLIPEAVMAVLSIVALRLEHQRRERLQISAR